jgi:glucokinase
VPRRTAIGVDLGGTKVAGVLMEEGGDVLRREERDTPSDAVVDTVVEVAQALQTGPAPQAIGVGAAGMVDFAAGAVPFAPNLSLRDAPIRDLVGRRTGLPCVVDNDANCAAWGEFRFGAGRPYTHMLLVTVGTGIGGGIVWNGELYRGAHGFAAEVGHFIVEPGGPRCNCGNLGCWEQVASGRAIDRLAVEESKRQPDGRIAALGRTQGVSGRAVSDAAGEGDQAALAIMTEVGRRLGEGIAGLVNVLDPQAVVVGGGVAEEGDLLLEPAREAFLDAVEAPDRRPEVPILAAELGNDAGALGAAALALETDRRSSGK